MRSADHHQLLAQEVSAVAHFTIPFYTNCLILQFVYTSCLYGPHLGLFTCSHLQPALGCAFCQMVVCRALLLWESYIKQGSKLCEGLKGLSATVEYVQLVNMVQPNTRDLMHSRNQVLRMYNKRKVRINIAKTQRPI